MSNKNFQIAKLFVSLSELKDKLHAEILPLAAHTGVNVENAQLYESLEILATDIDEHLKNFKLTVTKTNLKR